MLASGSQGNVDQSALHAAVGAILDDDKRRLASELVYSHAKVEGTETDGILVFRGIPYAAPPIGARRWKAPER